jgi:hypothetical protein
MVVIITGRLKLLNFRNIDKTKYKSEDGYIWKENILTTISLLQCINPWSFELNNTTTPFTQYRTNLERAEIFMEPDKFETPTGRIRV